MTYWGTWQEEIRLPNEISQGQKEAPTQPPLLLLMKELALSAQQRLALPTGAVPPPPGHTYLEGAAPRLVPSKQQEAIVLPQHLLSTDASGWAQAAAIGSLTAPQPSSMVHAPTPSSTRICAGWGNAGSDCALHPYTAMEGRAQRQRQHAWARRG